MQNEKDPNRNKNQHYVPESYFEEFSKDGSSVCGLFKKSGISIPHVSFSGQSSAAWFYGDAEREDEITESDTKYFENRKRILKALADGVTDLPPAEIEILLENTQFQRERTLSHRKAEQGVHEFHEDFFAPQVEDLDNYDSGHSPEATQAVNDAMRMFFKSFSDPRDSQFVKLMMIDKSDVADLQLIILKNCTSHPFIFSDSPIAYTNPALSDFKCDKLGNTNAGLQIFYPLNPDFLALFFDASVYRIGDAKSIVLNVTNDDDIAQINKLQLHEAANSIYFSRAEDSEYVKMLWREENSRFEQKTRNVEGVPELSIDGYVTGRHTYAIVESEPNFYPCLSFVTSDISSSNLPYRKAYWRRYLPEGAEIPRYNDEIDRHSEVERKE